jgi:hypothetical protein
MKIKSDLHAGMTYAECDSQRTYWKNMAQSGHCTGYGPQPPPPYYPPTPSGGDYVNGVWYPDMSGACG